MSIRIIWGALILGGLMAVSASPTPLLAQPTGMEASPKDPGVSTKNVAPNTNTNPTKHRHWRHRGGKHPHFGSRRVRT
ncbi:hypothetical protein [Bradyrhizobium sp. LVM 105]|uniref:hypothetical protein n=1 Tax=Bradyrhizobium sp. LVM 105 TaxID=2341115 RepID=UPI000F815683|nr:hypothetical protein [Bradyrhizobium sp. LVM 105]RTE92863.1 hypothetical protein D6B98_13950 [Bradyrhizobium sp. LVM 105]